MCDQKSIECGDNVQESNENLVKMHKRRNFQRQACLISVMAAFVIGLSLGVFVPVIGLGAAISHEFNDQSNFQINNNEVIRSLSESNINNNHVSDLQFPTIYDIKNLERTNNINAYAVSFVARENRKNKQNSKKYEEKLVKGYSGHFSKFVNENNDEFASEKTAVGNHAHLLKKPFLANFKRQNKQQNSKSFESFNNLQNTASKPTNIDDTNENPFDVIDENIFWGKVIENALPNGFSKQQTNDWNAYINSSIITKLEIGCGRMQNRLITFKDGRKACARYRQNTDQIQGELFSFYLGQLLNLSNLAPSTAAVIDLNSETWQLATQDIQNSQWKSQRPVVLTNWIPKLEAANIPTPFQPLERHLNKFDVKNITLGLDAPAPAKSLLDHLSSGQKSPNWNQLPLIQHPSDTKMNTTVLRKLIELAQWSDLIIFDYLIANLDRVVNNLYNFQWNADIMAAPAHNLARQSDSQLLVFLDNESGLLHGYRLLKKYETYHGLLLDNLCVFRRSTITALQQLQTDGIGKRLQQLFEQSTTDKVRDVLPSLPDKSIKILVDRIDRVLGQVEKCRELFSNR